MAKSKKGSAKKEGARGIKEECGTEKVIGYLIGEKLVLRLRSPGPARSCQSPLFSSQVRPSHRGHRGPRDERSDTLCDLCGFISCRPDRNFGDEALGGAMPCR